MKKNKRILVEDGGNDVIFTRDNSSVDQQIDDMINNSDRLAVISSVEAGQQSQTESVNRASLKFLLENGENDSPKINVGMFKTKISERIFQFKDVKGSIDVPGVIITRSRNYLKQKYGEKIESEFMKLLAEDIEVRRFIKDPNVGSSSSPPNQPLAVGAMGGAGGA